MSSTIHCENEAIIASRMMHTCIQYSYSLSPKQVLFSLDFIPLLHKQDREWKSSHNMGTEFNPHISLSARTTQ